MSSSAFDIRKAVDSPHAPDEAIVAVDENRQLCSDFGHEVELDLSATELECRQLHFPRNQIMSSDDWEATLRQVEPEQVATSMAFRGQVLAPFRGYPLPVIQLKTETSKEAVCLVFEKVNTGGVQLSVFELITASDAADGYNLRDDWFGSEVRAVESRNQRMEQDPLLVDGAHVEDLEAGFVDEPPLLRIDAADANMAKRVRIERGLPVGPSAAQFNQLARAVTAEARHRHPVQIARGRDRAGVEVGVGVDPEHADAHFACAAVAGHGADGAHRQRMVTAEQDRQTIVAELREDRVVHGGHERAALSNVQSGCCRGPLQFECAPVDPPRVDRYCLAQKRRHA